MRNGVETAGDVAFQDPLRRAPFSQYVEAVFSRIGGRSLRSKAVRIGICRGFRHGIKSQQVKRLHRSPFHDGNAQRTLLAVFLGEVYSPQGLGTVVPLPEPGDGVDLLTWSVPNDCVHSWGVLALVFRHSSDGKSFAAERVGQQTLQ